jgi:hypothetical protein
MRLGGSPFVDSGQWTSANVAAESGEFTLVYGCWKNAQKVQLGAKTRSAGLAIRRRDISPHVIIKSGDQDRLAFSFDRKKTHCTRTPKSAMANDCCCSLYRVDGTSPDFFAFLGRGCARLGPGIGSAGAAKLIRNSIQPGQRNVMPEQHPKNKKAKLALAIARGESVTEWASENGVPKRTAFHWAGDVKVRKAIEKWRRQALSQAIGRMAARAVTAADGIASLGEHADSESIRLRAYRAILADQMAVAKFSTLEQRMVEVEQKIEARDKPPAPAPAGAARG